MATMSALYGDDDEQEPLALQLDPRTLGRVPVPPQTMPVPVEQPPLQRGTPTPEQVYRQHLIDNRALVTNPMAVAQTPYSVVGAMAGSLLDRPGQIGPMLAAGSAEAARAPFAESVRDLTDPMKEARARGVEMPWYADLIGGLALDPTTYIGGGDPTDVLKPAIGAAAIVGPAALRKLLGFSTKLQTRLLPLIPAEGWRAEKVLAKMAQAGVSEAELEHSGVGVALRGMKGTDLVMPRDFENLVKEKDLRAKLYEHWYGNSVPEQEATNALHQAQNTVDLLSRRVPRMNQLLQWQQDLGGVMPTRDQVTARLLEVQPTMARRAPPQVQSIVDDAMEVLQANAEATRQQTRLEALGGGGSPLVWGDEWSSPGALNRREVVVGWRDVGDGGGEYMTYDNHRYKDPNPLGHARVGEFLTDDGRRVLMVDEIQSDVHQTAGRAHEVIVDDIINAADPTPEQTRLLPVSRKEKLAAKYAKTNPEWQAALDKKGYGLAYSPIDPAREPMAQRVGHGWAMQGRDAVPDVPYKGSDWQKLLMKRLMRYAAENGFDEFAWTTGMQQTTRYRKGMLQYDVYKLHPDGRIAIGKEINGQYREQVTPFVFPPGRDQLRQTRYAFGDGPARALATTTPDANGVRVLDTRVTPLPDTSGGMGSEYDVALNNIADSLASASKSGGKTRKIQIRTGEQIHNAPVYDGPLAIKDVTDRRNKYFMVTDAHGSTIDHFVAPLDNPQKLAEAEEAAAAALQRRNTDREVWAMDLTGHEKEPNALHRFLMDPNNLSIMSLVPPMAVGVGAYVVLRDGRRMRVTAVHDDGTFAATAAPLPRRVRRAR
jgi:hypothetical protein